MLKFSNLFTIKFLDYLVENNEDNTNINEDLAAVKVSTVDFTRLSDLELTQIIVNNNNNSITNNSNNRTIGTEMVTTQSELHK